MAASGCNDVAVNDLTLTASELPSDAFGFFITSQTQGFVMQPGTSVGNLCLSGNIGRYVAPGQVLNSGAQGSFSLVLDLTQTPQPSGLVSIAAGETWNFQAWHRDTLPSGPTSNYTEGFEISFQ